MKKTKRKFLHLFLALALMVVGGTAMMGFTDSNTAFAAEANLTGICRTMISTLGIQRFSTLQATSQEELIV